MDVGTLKRQIKNRELDSFYIFTGNEYKVQEIYLNKISEVTNKPISRISEISSLFNRGKALFSKPKLYVCRDDIEFIKSEKAWNRVLDTLGSDILILMCTDIDKRTKFYKHWADKIVSFEPMNESLILKYVGKEVKLNRDNILRLSDSCEGNYGKMLLEVDKIKSYMDGKSLFNCNEAFNTMMSQGAFYIPPQDAIFKFSDEVLSRHPYKAYDLLNECNKIGEPPLRLITVLYSNFKNLLQVQGCNSKDVAKATGLQWWEIKNAQDKLNCWSLGELVYIVRLLRDLEKGIKVGLIDDQFVMDYFMVSIF